MKKLRGLPRKEVIPETPARPDDPAPWSHRTEIRDTQGRGEAQRRTEMKKQNQKQTKKLCPVHKYIFFSLMMQRKEEYIHIITMGSCIFISLLRSRRGQMREQKADEPWEQAGERALQMPSKLGPWEETATADSTGQPVAGHKGHGTDQCPWPQLPKNSMALVMKGVFESQNQTCSFIFPSSQMTSLPLPSLLHIHSSLHRVFSFFPALCKFCDKHHEQNRCKIVLLTTNYIFILSTTRVEASYKNGTILIFEEIC